MICFPIRAFAKGACSQFAKYGVDCFSYAHYCNDWVQIYRTVQSSSYERYQTLTIMYLNESDEWFRKRRKHWKYKGCSNTAWFLKQKWPASQYLFHKLNGNAIGRIELSKFTFNRSDELGLRSIYALRIPVLTNHWRCNTHGINTHAKWIV